MTASTLSLVPREPKQPNLDANRRARATLKMLWMTRPALRPEIKARCSEPNINGFRFFCNHFLWAHNEHKTGKDKVRPVVLWEIQEEIAEEIIEEVFKAAADENYEYNAYGDKARMMAWTFLNLALLLWFWMFFGISSIITSKTEADVDTPADMDTPMEKLRFWIDILFPQVPWLFPEGFDPNNKKYYKTGLISAGKGGAQISGIAPKGAIMRQARALIWLADELPHTENDDEVWDAAAGTVRVRIGGGTPNIQRGKACKAYRLRYNKEGENARVFLMPWYRHPDRGRGLRRLPNGELTSDWMEEQRKKKSRLIIAAEYEMDWHAAMGGAAVFKKTWRPECKRPGLDPDPYGGPIYFGWDPGGACMAVVAAQCDRWGRLRALWELALSPDDAPEGKTLLDAVAERVIREMETTFRHFQVLHVGDPYGSRKQLASQKLTEYELLYRDHKIKVQSAYMYAIRSDDRKTRRHLIMGDLMSKDVVDEHDTPLPALLYDPFKLHILDEALTSGYRYVVDEKTGAIDYEEVAKNHPYNDVVDCLGMIAIKLFDVVRNTKEKQNRPQKPREKQPQGKWRQTQRMNSRYA